MLLGNDRGRITDCICIGNEIHARPDNHFGTSVYANVIKPAHKGSQQAHSMPARPFLNTVLLGVIKRLRAVLLERGMESTYRREIGVNPNVTVSKGPPWVWRENALGFTRGCWSLWNTHCLGLKLRTSNEHL